MRHCDAARGDNKLASISVELRFRINKAINYWDQEHTHLEEKTIIMMNWYIKCKSEIYIKFFQSFLDLFIFTIELSRLSRAAATQY